MDDIIDVVILDDDENQLTGVRIAIPREELDQFVSDFEEHFIKNYSEAEIL